MFRTLVATTLCLATTAICRGDDDINALTGRALAASRKIQAIDQQAQKATAELQQKVFGWEGAVRLLKKPPPAAEQIKQQEQEITYLRQQLAQAELRLKASRVRDPAERAAKAEEISKKVADLRVQLRTEKQPYSEKRQAVFRDNEDLRASFDKAVQVYFPQPADKWGELTKSVHASPLSGMISANWTTPDRKKVAWCHVVFYKSAEHHADLPLLDDKYLLINDSPSGPWVRAGAFEVRFIVEKDEWKTKEKAREALKAFVDLKGLSAIKPSE